MWSERPMHGSVALHCRRGERGLAVGPCCRLSRTLLLSASRAAEYLPVMHTTIHPAAGCCVRSQPNRDGQLDRQTRISAAVSIKSKASITCRW